MSTIAILIAAVAVIIGIKLYISIFLWAIPHKNGLAIVCAANLALVVLGAMIALALKGGA